MPQNMTNQELRHEYAPESGVEPEKKVREDGDVVVKADDEAKQATEVRPMRYVLGIGLGLVIVGMAVAYLST